MKRPEHAGLPIPLVLAAGLWACTTDPVLRPEMLRPAAPLIETIIADDASVHISFIRPDSASSIVVVQFVATCVGGGTAHTASGPGSPITVAGLTNGTLYTCTLTAVGANANSSASAPVSVRPGLLPNPPDLFLLNPGNGNATAIFNPPMPKAGAFPVSMYRAECMLTDVATLRSAEGASSPITVTSMSNGQRYDCTVSAITAFGTVVSSSLGVIPGTPLRPLSPTATPGNASATLTFLPSSDNGSPVTGYTATCSAAGQATVSVDGTASPITVTGLTNGAAYTCNVFASNSVGPGQLSAGMPVTIGTPTAPTSVSATPANGSATFSFGPPTSDNGAPITSYTVRCFQPGPVDPPPVSGPSSPLIMTGLINGVPLACTIHATNANGTGLAAFVNVTPAP